MGARNLGDRGSARRTLADVVRISSAEIRRDSPSKASSDSPIPAHAQAICVASGKGGTGKTIFTTNICTLLAESGHRVTLIDADLGLANSHLLLGLEPAHDISQLIAGEKTVHEVLIEGPHGMKVLPGGSGIAELSELNEGQLSYLASQMAELERDSDLLLIDCSAGITRQVMRFMASAHHTVVVTTPEVTSMIDAYAVIKNIHYMCPEMPLWLVVNRIKEPADAETVFSKMKEVVGRRIGNVNMKLLGSIPHDRYVLHSVALRKPVTIAHPRCFATACFADMAKEIAGEYRLWRREQGRTSAKAPSYFWSLAGRRYG